MKSEKLLYDCPRLKEGPKSLKYEAVYCMRQRVEHNSSLQNGRYSDHKVLEYSYFYTIFLLHCPVSEPDENITGSYKRACEVCSSSHVLVNFI